MSRPDTEGVPDPDSVSEDKMVQVFLNKLASYYLKSEDANVLRAVDDTPIDGGFANFVCGFYKDVIRSPAALQHYRKDCRGLRRCIGLSFSSEEANNICSNKDTKEVSPTKQ
jgi:hypothetical protein